MSSTFFLFLTFFAEFRFSTANKKKRKKGTMSTIQMFVSVAFLEIIGYILSSGVVIH